MLKYESAISRYNSGNLLLSVFDISALNDPNWLQKVLFETFLFFIFIILNKKFSICGFYSDVNTVVCHPFVCRVNTSLSVSRRGTAVNIRQMKAAQEFAALMSGIGGHAVNN